MALTLKITVGTPERRSATFRVQGFSFFFFDFSFYFFEPARSGEGGNSLEASFFFVFLIFEFFLIFFFF